MVLNNKETLCDLFNSLFCGDIQASFLERHVIASPLLVNAVFLLSLQVDSVMEQGIILIEFAYGKNTAAAGISKDRKQ